MILLVHELSPEGQSRALGFDKILSLEPRVSIWNSWFLGPQVRIFNSKGTGSSVGEDSMAREL